MNKLKTISIIFLSLSTYLWSHPIPDITVRSNLEKNILKTQIELDIRCLDEDPEGAPYILNEEFAKWSQVSKNTAFELAKNYIKERIQFVFNDRDGYIPTYKLRFMKLGGGELKGPKDVVVIALETERNIEKSGVMFSVKSRENNQLSIEVMNKVNGKTIPRTACLFPGEKSYEWSLMVD